MLENPECSVCIRAYRPDFLAGALTSALAQDIGGLEVVIVDDGDCREVVERFSDPRIRYERNARRLGSTANAARALDLARGRYIMVFGDDDLMLPGFLERCRAPLEADPALGVAFSDHLIEAAGQRRRRDWRMSPGPLSDPLKTVIGPRNPVCISAALLRATAWRQVRDRFPTDPLLPADVPLWVSLAQRGWGFFGVEEPLIVWGEHPGQITAQVGEMRERNVRLWEALHFPRRDCERLRRAQLADALISRAAFRLRKRDAPGARADLLRATRTSPRAWRPRAAGLALLLALPPLRQPAMSLHARVRARRNQNQHRAEAA